MRKSFCEHYSLQNGDNLLIHDIYLDGKLVEGKRLIKRIVAKSGPLAAGSHSWQVVSSVVNGRLYRSLLESIARWKASLSTLKMKLNDTIDPEERLSLEKEILAMDRKVLDARSLLSKEKKPVSVPVNLPFEVQ